MVIFNSYVTNYQRVNCIKFPKHIAMEGGLLRIWATLNPKSSTLRGFSMIFQPFWDTTILRNTMFFNLAESC